MPMWVLFIHFCYLYSTFVESQCVTPPLECPNENITFWLYTRANKDNPHQVMAMEPDTIDSAPWVKNAPIKILIHGYTGHKNFSPSAQLRPAYLTCCDYNIISVDYHPIAKSPCYVEAAHNVELVGKCIAQLIDKMVQNHNFEMKLFHVIGFSLGGQAAGAIGNHLERGPLHRLTGLDPALPLFATNDKNKKIDVSDAIFVDVLHSNALEKGKLESCGHVDFYPNGGLKQPGCKATEEQTQSSCDHTRATEYFAESITTKVGFYATKCFSWITYMIGWCEVINSNDEILFGEYVPLDASGLYFFRTNSESPFARGPSKKSNEESGKKKRSLIIKL